MKRRFHWPCKDRQAVSPLVSCRNLLISRGFDEQPCLSSLLLFETEAPLLEFVLPWVSWQQREFRLLNVPCRLSRTLLFPVCSCCWTRRSPLVAPAEKTSWAVQDEPLDPLRLHTDNLKLKTFCLTKRACCSIKKTEWLSLLNSPGTSKKISCGFLRRHQAKAIAGAAKSKAAPAATPPAIAPVRPYPPV